MTASAPLLYHPCMNRCLRIVGALAVPLMVVAVALPAIGDWLPGGGQVYAIGQVTDELRLHPASWVGRTIRLRAEAESFANPCARGGSRCGFIYTLTDQVIMPAPPGRTLLLRFSGEDRLFSRLRQFPVVGGMLPAPQWVFGRGTYLVRLEPALPSLVCTRDPCYQVVVLDAMVPI